jgi:hypothetical protein
MGVVSDKTATIDGINYSTKTLPASEGLKLAPKLISLFGEDVLSLFAATSDDDKAERLLERPEVLGAVLTNMAERATDSDDGWLVLKELMRYTKSDRVRIGEVEGPGSVYDHFDTHFAGRYQHLLQVAMWAAMAGFGGP